jgi:hypothetical protein
MGHGPLPGISWSHDDEAQRTPVWSSPLHSTSSMLSSAATAAGDGGIRTESTAAGTEQQRN